MPNRGSTFGQLMSQLGESRVEKCLIEAAIHGDDPDALGLAYSIMLDEQRHKYIEPAFQWAEVSSLLQVYFRKCIFQDYESEWADSKVTAMYDCLSWLRATWDESEEDVRRSWRAWLQEVAEEDIEVATRLSAVIHDGTAPARLFGLT